MKMVIEDLKQFCEINKEKERQLLIVQCGTKWRVKLEVKGYITITLKSARKQFREFGNVEAALKECSSLSDKILIILNSE